MVSIASAQCGRTEWAMREIFAGGSRSVNRVLLALGLLTVDRGGSETGRWDGHGDMLEIGYGERRIHR
jgi:hypothetical protein